MYTRLTHAFQKIKTLFTSSPPMPEDVDRVCYALHVDDYAPLLFVDDHDRARFLEEMHRIHESGQLSRIVNDMAECQIRDVALYARDMAEVNHGRATVNGFHLLEGEIKKYATIYDEEHAHAQSFDKFEILS